MPDEMPIDRAREILGCGDGMADDRRRAFDTKRAILERKFAEAPSPRLKERYALALKELELAFETLELRGTEAEIGFALADRKPEGQSPALPGSALPRSRRKWFPLATVLATAAVGIAVLVAVDGPNRVRASWINRQARERSRTGDWPAAVEDWKSANRLRPSDIEYADAYRNAQAVLLQDLETKVAGMSARDAFVYVKSPGIDRIRGFLAEPFATQYRGIVAQADRNRRAVIAKDLTEVKDLVGKKDFKRALALIDKHREFGGEIAEISAADKFVRVSAIRAEIEAILVMADREEFESSLARLDQIADRHLAPGPVEQARKLIRQQAEVAFATRLGAEILAQDAAKLSATLGEYARVSGIKFSTTAERLLNRNQLGDFLTALEELKIRPGRGETRTRWLDVNLVEQVRSRFGTADVRQFLAGAYEAWATTCLEQKLSGAALYLGGLAHKEQAGAASGLLARAREQAIADQPHTVLLMPTEGNPQNAAAALEHLREALRMALKDHAWLRVLDNPVTNAAPIRQALVRTALRGLEVESGRDVTLKSITYRSGTKQVPNPLYNVWQDSLEMARQNEADHQRLLNEIDPSDTVWAITFGREMREKLSAAQAEVRRCESELRNIPPFRSEPVYSDELYQEITHKFAYALRWTVTVGDQPPVVFAASRDDAVIEVAGNASHGVPVRAAQFPSLPRVAENLSQQIARDMSSRSAEIAQLIQSECLRLLDEQVRTENLDPLAAASLRWACLQAWGVRPAQAFASEAALRRALGLGAGPRA